jgi:hypothetical protein
MIRKKLWKVPYRSMNTYNFRKEPDCEFCDNALYFIVGMYFGYHMGKRKH